MTSPGRLSAPDYRSAGDVVTFSGAAVAAAGRITAMAVIGLMALWVLIFALMEVRTGHSSPRLLARLRTLTRSQWGMVLGHVGVAVTVIGITFSQNYSVERDVRMRPGDSII